MTLEEAVEIVRKHLCFCAAATNARTTTGELPRFVDRDQPWNAFATVRPFMRTTGRLMPSNRRLIVDVMEKLGYRRQVLSSEELTRQGWKDTKLAKELFWVKRDDLELFLFHARKEGKRQAHLNLTLDYMAKLDALFLKRLPDEEHARQKQQLEKWRADEYAKIKEEFKKKRRV